MKKWCTLLSVLILLCLVGCQCGRNPYLFKNYCQKDYWGDTQFEIFGRKNCVGDAGHWVDQDNGRAGYYCTSPNCKTFDRVNCKATCCYN